MKNFSKLRRGDKILIKRNLIPGHRYGCNIFVDQMLPSLGKEVIISSFTGNRTQLFIVGITNRPFLYTPEMIERKISSFKFGKS